jgi:RNA polymerase sigma-70 factor (ECF subfamily)
LTSINVREELVEATALAERRVVEGLVAQAQQGSADAFGALYDRFQPDILRYLTNHMRDRDGAEDVTQQVFLNAWRAIPRYEQRSVPFKSWLYRMAHNQMVDHFRAHRRPPRDLEGIDPPVEAEAEATVLASERRVLLETAMQRLSDDHREVLTLRFLMEQSAAEAGEVMGRKEVTLRGLQLRALRALRREIESLGGAL